MDKKVSLISLGCAKNLVDSEVLVGGLKHEKFEITQIPEESDIAIVNTCGFLDTAREESVDTILEAVKLKEAGDIEQLIVMGCFSDRYGSELINEIPEVDKFFGTNDHDKILSFLTGKEHTKQDPDYYRSMLTPKHYGYLKIAEGCDNGCSFCAIPIMRGLQESQPVAWNLAEARRMADSGVKELLVIAQDTTSYGWDLEPRSSLHELMDALDTVDGIEWIRLHYAFPGHLHRNMIERFRTLDKLLPYIDMPVQHGSQAILKSMRRGLGPDGIKKRINALRDAAPDIAVRTSMIVGFPGETDDDFKQLCDFVEDVRFDRLGVFMYSDEDGTHAGDTMTDNVPKDIKTERMDKLMLLQQKISLENNRELIGSTQDVIIDSHTQDKRSIGRTYRDSPEIDNLVIAGGELSIGEIYSMKINDAFEYDLLGEVVDG